MASTKSDTTAIPDLGREALAALALNPLAGPQFHQFWEVQEKLLAEVETFSKHWFERRHEAARTALRASSDLFSQGRVDPGAAAKAMQDWQAHSAERVAEDIREWLDLCTRCAGHFVRGEVSANRETLETVSEVAKKATAKHATPL